MGRSYLSTWRKFFLTDKGRFMDWHPHFLLARILEQTKDYKARQNKKFRKNMLFYSYVRKYVISQHQIKVKETFDRSSAPSYDKSNSIDPHSWLRHIHHVYWMSGLLPQCKPTRFLSVQVLERRIRSNFIWIIKFLKVSQADQYVLIVWPVGGALWELSKKARGCTPNPRVVSWSIRIE